MTLSPIYITNEPNDKDLTHHINGLSQVVELACGDVNFLGHWINDEQVWVWIERKKLSDLVTCVMDSGRLLRQIQDAHQAGFKHKALIIEAIYRRSPGTGLVEYRRGKEWVEYHLNPKDKKSPTIQYSRIEGYLNQLRYYLGVQVYHTVSARDTALTILDIYGMFQRPPEDHDSLKQFAITPEPVASFLGKPSLLRRIAKELPHIGWDRSKDLEGEFKTAREMLKVLVEGDRERLLGIEGIGKKTVNDIEVALDDGN